MEWFPCSIDGTEYIQLSRVCLHIRQSKLQALDRPDNINETKLSPDLLSPPLSKEVSQNRQEPGDELVTIQLVEDSWDSIMLSDPLFCFYWGLASEGPFGPKGDFAGRTD